MNCEMRGGDLVRLIKPIPAGSTAFQPVAAHARKVGLCLLL
jgi:hypothetical protein